MYVHVQCICSQVLSLLGCAPPPTAYDPKSGEKAAGGVVDKSERFKTPKGKSMVLGKNDNFASILGKLQGH